MTRTTSDWIRAAEREIQTLGEQATRCERARAEHLALEQELEQRVGGELEGTLDQLLAGGALTVEGVAAAARWTGCAGLEHLDPQQRVAARQAELQAELAELEGEELWPQVEEELPRLREECEAKERELAGPGRFLRQAAHPRLTALLESGYGTDAYEGAWWRLSYYSDWKAGDEVLESFPEFEEFGPFAEEYRRQSNLHTGLGSELASLEAERDDLLRLQTSHFETTQRLGSVEKDVAEEVRAALQRHISIEQQAAFARRVPDDSPQAAQARRWIGMRKQLGYLQDLRHNHLDPFGKRMRASIDKLRRKVAKYRRPKHAGTRFSDAEFERTFPDRALKYEKFWKVYELAFAALRDFQRHEYGRFEEDFLWWDLIGEGRVRNRFSPEVTEFYGRYPDYEWEQPWEDDWDDEAEAAAATVEAYDDYDDGGYDAS